MATNRTSPMDPPRTRTRPRNASASPKAGTPQRGSSRKPATTREPAWTEIANFVVTFESRKLGAVACEQRITAHKMQEGGITAKWTGVEPQLMCGWIAAHVGDWGGDLVESQGPQAALLPSTPAGRLPGLSIKVSGLHAIQAGGAVARRDAAPVGGQHGGLDYELQAVVEIDGCDGPASAGGDLLQCPVEFFSRNMATAEKTRLGETRIDALVRGQSSYAVTLPKVRLAPGTYTLACVARLNGAAVPFAGLQGPLLQVP